MPTDRSPLKTRSGQVKHARDKAEAADKIQGRTTSESSLASTDNETTIRSAVEGVLASEEFFKRISELVVAKVAEMVSQEINSALQQALANVEQLKTQLELLRDKETSLENTCKCRADEMEQYMRRNNLRVFGIQEKEGEDTDQLLLDLFKNKLNVDVQLAEIDRSHRVGPVKPERDGRKRQRPIIVKFVSYRIRKEVFNNKKKLKGSGVTIREDLTSHRAGLLRQATEKFGVGNVWTLDGSIRWICDGVRGRATWSLPPLGQPAT